MKIATTIFHDEGAITYIHNIQAKKGKYSAVMKKKNDLSLFNISLYVIYCHSHWMISVYPHNYNNSLEIIPKIADSVLLTKQTSVGFDEWTDLISEERFHIVPRFPKCNINYVLKTNQQDKDSGLWLRSK